MIQKEIPKEHKKRLDAVINYILKNLNEDVSLDVLAEVANYSPAHLQKLFKQVMGESPKKYIIRLRLETSAHHLIIYPHKSITEIALDCNFSSPAVFSRAFKNYFKISAQEMRLQDPKDQLIIRKESFHLKEMINQKIVFKKGSTKKSLKIEVRRMASSTGICINANLNDEKNIQQSFKEVIRFANVNDLLFDNSKVLGILYPHQDRYNTFVSITNDLILPKNTETDHIKAGKYAVFKVKGPMKNTFDALGILTREWLPESGYQIADFSGFELFSQNPAIVKYSELDREVYIPIEPA